MEVIPAIDIKGGKCVRLYQGDYGRETVFSDDPVTVAKNWAGQGVPRLHVIDLDGAKEGTLTNIELVGQIALAVDIPMQLGGGIRTLESARRATGLGIARVILGTAAIESPEVLSELCRALGEESVVVSVDARNGRVALSGWTRESSVETSELLERIEDLGMHRFVYTDITRDGTLTEPNFGAIEELRQQTSLKMLVAGGIASIAHLQRLSDLGVEGSIVGTAAYTGAIDIREAARRLGGPAVTGNARN